MVGLFLTPPLPPPQRSSSVSTRSLLTPQIMGTKINHHAWLAPALEHFQFLGAGRFFIMTLVRNIQGMHLFSTKKNLTLGQSLLCTLDVTIGVTPTWGKPVTRVSHVISAPTTSRHTVRRWDLKSPCTRAF